MRAPSKRIIRTAREALDAVPFGLLKPLVTPAILERVRKRLRLTDDKLVLLLVRLLNPDEIITQGEEATLRGVRKDTLKKYKDAKEFPRFVNGR